MWSKLAGAMPVLGRLLIGTVFVFAGIEKAADPEAFAAAAANYRIIQGSAAMVLATVLPWIELMCGFALLFGVCVRGSALLCALMLSGFTAAIASALLRGLDISCGCFSLNAPSEGLGLRKVVENVLLLAVAVWLLVRFPGKHAAPEAAPPPSRPPPAET